MKSNGTILRKKEATNFLISKLHALYITKSD